MHTILIAEENGAFRHLVSTVLTAVGYEVIPAGDDTEAINAAKGCRSPIHLLCANMTESHVNGVALAESLKPQHPEMKVLLLLTDDPRFVSVDTKTADRHSDYVVLRKPFTLDEFTAKVKQILTPAAVSG